MRGLMCGLGLLSLGLGGCWGPIDQTSPTPGGKVPSAAFSREVKDTCKAHPDLDNPFCKQLKAHPVPAAHGDGHGHGDAKAGKAGEHAAH
jgi:hypothetical protein